MTLPTPLFDCFKRGEVARDIRLMAAQGAVAPKAPEQLAILTLLADDADPEIRDAARETLERIPKAALSAFLAHPDVDPALQEYFNARGVPPAEEAATDVDEPLIDTDPGDLNDADMPPEAEPEPERALTAVQLLARMGFSERLKTAIKGSREMRGILIRDASKVIAAAVLSSPKLSEQEVETYARMANVSEDVLRVIGNNRKWTKSYGVMASLVRNPKTPLAVSLTLFSRLHDKDLQMLSMDRNVPDPLRVAARKRVVASMSKQ